MMVKFLYAHITLVAMSCPRRSVDTTFTAEFHFEKMALPNVEESGDFVIPVTFFKVVGMNWYLLEFELLFFVVG